MNFRNVAHEPLWPAACFGAAALTLTLFASWHGTPMPGDPHLIREVQELNLLRGNEGWVNVLGTLPLQVGLVIAATTLIAVGPASRAATDGAAHRNRAIWLLLVAISLRFLAQPLKLAAQAERPIADFGIRVTQEFAGYGFPSGHVYSDVLIFGALAVAAPLIAGRAGGAALRVACVAVIAMSGPARMVVGAHWPSDVLGGYLWGACVLLLAFALSRRLAPA